MTIKAPDIQSFIRENTKVFIVLATSLMCVYLINKRFSIDTKVIFQISFAVGFLHQVSLHITSIYLRRKTDLRKWHTYIRPNKRYSAGKLMFHLVQFLLLIYIIPFDSWNVATTTLILVSFLGGMCLGHIIASLIFKENSKDEKFTERRIQLDNERYEAFVATIIASVVLGSSFLQMNNQNESLSLNGFILLPLAYSIINSFITYFYLCLDQNYNRIVFKYYLFISILSVGIHLIIIDVLVVNSLPDYFLLKGIEYSSDQIKSIMKLGLLSGFVAGVLVLSYHYLTKLHIKKLLKSAHEANVYKNIIIRVFLNIIVYFSPILCVVFTFYYSMQTIGLYGLTLSFLCMLSNIGLKLFIQYDRLDFSSNYNNLNTTQIELLEKKSPKLFQLLVNLK